MRSMPHAVDGVIDKTLDLLMVRDVCLGHGIVAKAGRRWWLTVRHDIGGDR